MTTYTDRQKACIRDVLTSMECTAQWLENGSDPKEAAAEIRLAMSRLTVESTSPITGFSEPDGGADVQAVITEMIAVATSEDDDGDWPIELRAEVDKWQSRLQIALATPSQPAAPAEHWQASDKGLVSRVEPSTAAQGATNEIYVASRASIPDRPNMWKGLRMSGWPIVSTWIDESGEGETDDFTELWTRIENEIRSAAGVLLYAETADFPLKGALIECGLALGMGKPVAVVLPNVALHPRSMKPIGSWVRHPLVTIYPTLSEARDALLTAPTPVADSGAMTEAAMHKSIKFLSKSDQGRVMGAFREALAAKPVSVDAPTVWKVTTKEQKNVWFTEAAHQAEKTAGQGHKVERYVLAPVGVDAGGMTFEQWAEDALEAHYDEHDSLVTYDKTSARLGWDAARASMPEREAESLAIDKLKAALRTDNQRARQYLLEEAVDLLNPPTESTGEPK